MIKKVALLTTVISSITVSSTFAYSVKEGDTLSGIAESHKIPLEDIIKANQDIQDINLIFPKQTINLTLSDKEVASEVKEVKEIKSTEITSYEKDLLARLVRAEAEGESFLGKVAVAITVLNRVDDPQFPNSIHGVIYQKNQFSPTANGSIDKYKANEESLKAVEHALQDRSLTKGALYFYNPSIATNRWQDSLETTVRIGSHVFKK